MQGGVACLQKYCEATEADTAGVVFLIVLIGKPPRPRCKRMLRAVFLIARPPLLAVMQGGDYRLISIHSHVHMTAVTVSYPFVPPPLDFCIIPSTQMRNRFRDAVLVITTAIIVAAGVLAVHPAGAVPDSQTAQVKRTPDGKLDLSGIWQTNSTANWDLLT